MAVVLTAVRIVVCRGAFHAFDVQSYPRRCRYGFGTIGYQPEAAASARKEVEQFLLSVLVGTTTRVSATTRPPPSA